MAQRKTGVELSVDGLSRYISDLNKAGDANKDFLKSFGSGNIGSSLEQVGRQGGSAFSVGFAAGIGSAIGTAVIDAAKAAVGFAVDVIKQGLQSAEYVIKIGVDYQQAVANVEAGLALLHPELVPSTGPNAGIFDPATAKQLKDTINSIAIDPHLVVDFKDAAKQAQILTRYGLSVREISDGGLRSAVLLQNAIGGGFDLAAETLAKYQKIFALSPDKLTGAVSEIAGVVTAGGFRDLNDYRYAITNASEAAGAFGASQEDINTILAISNKYLSSGRVSGTTLRTTYEHLIPTSKKATAALKDLNLSFIDQDGNVNDIGTAITKLRKATAGLTQADRIKHVEDIFGATASKLVLGLLSETTDAQIAQTRAIIVGADATKAAAIQSGTLGERAKNAAGQIESLIASLFPEDAQNNVAKALGAFQDLLTGLQPKAEALGLSISAALKGPSEAVAAFINDLGKTGAAFGRFNFGNLKGFGAIDLNKLIFGGGLDLGKVNITGALNLKDKLFAGSFSISDLFTITGAIDLKQYIAAVSVGIGDYFTFTGGIDLSKYVVSGSIDIPSFLKLSGSFDLANFKFTGESDFSGLSDGIGKITGAFGLLSVAVQAIDQGLQQITSPTGGLGLAAAFVTGAIQNVSNAIGSIDQSKALAIGGGITTLIVGVAGALTTLLKFDVNTIGDVVGALSSLQQNILNFATNIVKGIDAQKLSGAATTFVTTYIDGFSKAITELDLPGIADAAGNFVLAVSDQFKNALAPGNLTSVGASLGSLTTTILGQLSAVLSDKKFAADLGKSFANIVVGITQGLSDVLAGFNKTTDNQLQNQQISGGVTSFIQNFLDGVADGLAKADYGNVVHSFVSSLLGSLLGGKEVMADLQAISDNGASFTNVFKLLKDINNLGGENPFVAAGRNLSGTTPEERQREAINARRKRLGLPPVDSGNGSGGFGGTGDVPVINQTTEARHQPLDATTSWNKLETLIAGRPSETDRLNALANRIEARVAALGDKATPADKEAALAARRQADAANAQSSGGILDSLKGLIISIAKTSSLGSIVPVSAGRAIPDLRQKDDNAALNPTIPVAVNPPTRQVETPVGALSVPKIDTGVAQIGTQTVTAATVTISTPTATVTGAATTNGLGGDRNDASRTTPAPTVPTPSVDNFIPPEYTSALTTAGTTVSGAATTAASAITAGGASVQAAGAAAAANLNTVGPFPGWHVFFPYVSIPPVPPFPGWAAVISQLGLAPSAPAPSLTKQALGFAKGTPFVPRTGAYLVGEKGAEIVTLPRGAGVIPAGLTSRILGGFASGTTGDPTGLLGRAANLLNTVSSPQKPPLNIQPQVAPEDAKKPIPGAKPPINIKPNIAPPDAQAAVQKAFKDTKAPVNIDPKTGLPAGANAANAGASSSKTADAIIADLQKFQDSIKAVKPTIDELQSSLKSIPGVLSASPVTQDQLDAAKAGIPQNFADDFVRRLGAEVANHNTEYGNLMPQAIDALQKAGITPGGTPEAVLAQIKEGFSTGSLFSNPENLKLINTDAIAQALQTQQKQKQGATNEIDFLTSMFGGTDIASLLGDAINTAAQSTPGRSRRGAGTGGAAAGAAATGDAVDQGIIPQFPAWNGAGGIIPNFPPWKGSNAIIPDFPGWGSDEDQGGFIPLLDWSEFVGPPKTTTTPATGATTTPTKTTTPPKKKATGTNFFPGGAGLFGEHGPELGIYPRGTRVYPAYQTSRIMSIAEALGSIPNSVYGDPAKSIQSQLFDRSGYTQQQTRQQQTAVFLQPQRQVNSSTNHVRHYNLTLQTNQQSQGIMRDFQYMQVVGS